MEDAKSVSMRMEEQGSFAFAKSTLSAALVIAALGANILQLRQLQLFKSTDFATEKQLIKNVETKNDGSKSFQWSIMLVDGQAQTVYFCTKCKRSPDSTVEWTLTEESSLLGISYKSLKK